MKYFRIPGIGLELPYDKESYIAALKKIMIPYLAIGLVVIFLVWGEILFQDILGLIFTSFIVAYIWHIVEAFEGGGS